MSFIVRVIVSVLLCSVTFGRGNPLGSTDTVVERPPDNPFDGGEINSCVRLNPENVSTYCTIDYDVPAYVAAIAPILLSEIRGALSNARSDSCSTTLREILCSRKFPRCRLQESGDVHIEQTYTQSCNQRLQTDCSTERYNQLQQQHVCGFPNVTARDTDQLPASPCQPVAEYEFNLQLCHTAIDADKTMVTPWMFELMKQKDAVVHSELRDNLGGLLIDRTCQRKWAAYYCQSVGRCNSDGTRIELVNTMEDCEMLLQCFPHSIADTFSEEGSIPCSLWPNRLLYPVEPSNSPSSHDEIHSTPSSQRPKFSWPSPGDLTLGPVDSSSSLVVATKFLMFSLTLLTLLVVSCLQ